MILQPKTKTHNEETVARMNEWKMKSMKNKNTNIFRLIQNEMSKKHITRAKIKVGKGNAGTVSKCSNFPHKQVYCNDLAYLMARALRALRSSLKKSTPCINRRAFPLRGIRRRSPSWPWPPATVAREQPPAAGWSWRCKQVRLHVLARHSQWNHP